MTFKAVIGCEVPCVTLAFFNEEFVIPGVFVAKEEYVLDFLLPKQNSYVYMVKKTLTHHLRSHQRKLLLKQTWKFWKTPLKQQL